MSYKQTNPQTPPSKRKRVTKACLSCAKSRRKCDGIQPMCGTCRLQGVACGWSDISSRRGPPKGYRRGNADPQSLQPKIAKIREHVEALKAAYGKMYVLRELETALFGSIIHGAESESPVTVSGKDTSDEEDDMYEEEERTPSEVDVDEGTSSGIAFLATSVRRMQSGKQSEKDVIDPSSPNARISITRYSPWFHEVAKGERHRRQRSDEQVLSVSRRIRDPQPAEIEFYFKIYWSAIHPHWPILYKPSFDNLSIFNLADYVSRALLFAVYALAARLAPNGGSPGAAEKAACLSMAYFDVAHEEVLKGGLCSDIDTCTTLFLLSLHYHGEGNQRQAWVLCGLAATMALDLGLHRVTSSLTEEEHERRVRVFWNLYCYDKILSAEMGRPITLHAVHCDQVHLSEEQPDEYETVVHPGSGQAVRLYTISIFNAAIELFRIFERILSEVHTIPMKTVNGAVSGQSRAARERLVTELDQDLENWQATLPAKCGYPRADDRHPTRTRFITHAWYLNGIILLHRPLIPRLRPGPGYLGNVHHRRATDAANQLVDLLDQYAMGQEIEKLPPNDAYLIFTAAVLHCFNIGLDDRTMREAARSRLEKCLEWLKGLAETWPAASPYKRLLDAFSQAASNTMSRTFTPQDYPVSTLADDAVGASTYHQAMPYASQQAADVQLPPMHTHQKQYVVPQEVASTPELFSLESMYWNDFQTVDMGQLGELYGQATEVAPSGVVYHDVLRYLEDGRDV